MTVFLGRRLVALGAPLSPALEAVRTEIVGLLRKWNTRQGLPFASGGRRTHDADS